MTDTHPGPSITTEPAESGAVPSSGRRILFGVLVVALLASVALFGWVAWERRGTYDDVQAQREQAMNTAEQFVLRMSNLDPADLDEKKQLPEWRARLKDISTTSYYQELLDGEIPFQEKFVARFKLKRKTDVYATGVHVIDSDSATVIVAGAITDKFGSTPPREPYPFRMDVHLVKVDGAWKVNAFDKAGDQK